MIEWLGGCLLDYWSGWLLVGWLAGALFLFFFILMLAFRVLVC